MQIENSTAIVTGGASGLGLATATALVERGAEVFVLDLASDHAEAMVAALGDRAHLIPTDVRDEVAVQRAVDTAASAGDLRICVNCAGVGTPGKLVGREGPLALEQFTKVVGINLGGTVNVMAHAAAAMQRVDPLGEERGVIINTASVAAYDGQIGQIAYSASKGGVAAVTLPAARELARHRIRVMTIAPGTFETPMMASLPEAARESLGQQVPHPSRLGRPDEYADLVLAILQNPMLNGEVIRLDGAIRMAPK
jgi:NAD(P)-dependent dehydrogenase (short-subunit alcohol dehydrogenase family)